MKIEFMRMLASSLSLINAFICIILHDSSCWSVLGVLRLGSSALHKRSLLDYISETWGWGQQGPIEQVQAYAAR